jgi:serine/threonine protein kinase/Tfp pilus assembly protein PilF
MRAAGSTSESSLVMPEQLRNDEVVMSLVDLALERPAQDRESYVRSACGGDQLLFDEVWNYVRWEERMDGFLLEPLIPATADDHPLEPGELLLNRFRILREVGHGGMGVVYEAMDEKLGRRTAIKCARAGFHKRLSPEVRNASEIAHPNICKTWEIHTASGAGGDFDFLTMEFIEGRTLAERLREGPVKSSEAGVIASQLCAGLAEAHRRNVIHGDLKSSNVLLSPMPDGIRAVITDFGLASQAESHSTAHSSERGGTLDYMAPELLKGAPPSSASDIYALGVILHELATGQKPWQSAASWEERLTRRPVPLAHRWNRIVLSCLEPDPARRCGHVAEAAAALDTCRSARRWKIAAAVILAASLSAFAAWRAASTPQQTIRLATLPFAIDDANRSLEEGLLQDTVDRLSHLKSGRSRLAIVPVADAVQYQVDAPAKAARVLGATHVLSGSFHLENGHLRIESWVTDARSLLPIKQWSADYSPAELPHLPEAFAAEVVGIMGLPPLAAAVRVNDAAYPDFTAGVGLSRQSTGIDAAIPFLERAVAADPDSPLTHARLAEAQALKFRQANDAAWLEKSRSSFEAAKKRNPDLPLVLLVGAMLNEYIGNWDAAESDLRRALQIEPENGDVWRRLALVYQDSNRFPNAVAAYQKSIEVEPGYFKNHQGLCALYGKQAEYEKAIDECRKMVELTPDLWESHFALGVPYFNWGHYAEGEAEFRRALALNPADSRVIQSLAVALFYQSRFNEAIPLFRRAIEIGPATDSLYFDLGTSFDLLGQHSDARMAYRQGVALVLSKLARNPRDVSTKALLAVFWARLDERTLAESEASQAYQLAPGSVEVEEHLIRTYESLGERERALGLIRSLPPGELSRLNRSPDLVELRRDTRFHDILQSHQIK